MSIGTVIVICLVFGAIFVLAGRYLSGGFRTAVQFLSGAIIVIVLLVFLLALFGVSLR